MQRLIVVGTTGSGKTQLARQIAGRLGVPHIELDALHWEPKWTMVETTLFRERVARAVAGQAWVVDGNYSKVRDLVWPRAEVLVWLDYPLLVSLWRLAWRTTNRILGQEPLWNGNRESIRNVLLSRDSLFLWAIRTHNRHRREFTEEPRRPGYAHLTVVRLRSPAATRAWLHGLPPWSAKTTEARPP